MVNKSSRISVFLPTNRLEGKLHIGGSKSISNRILLIQKLAAASLRIDNLSDSQDTSLLKEILNSEETWLDAHHAGTTFRFATAYFALQAGERTLTGSERMKQRPIGPLVESLKHIGAEIEYLEKEGYPPLKIKGYEGQKKEVIEISGGMSSQFISALCMIAPALENGLQIKIVGELVSRPYLQMTLSLMEKFGVSYEWKGSLISIPTQAYTMPSSFQVESDWSSASYYFAMAALAEDVDLTLTFLENESLQADRAIVDFARDFGVHSTFEKGILKLRKSKQVVSERTMELDFLASPDIAQTVAVMCAGQGRGAKFTGLQTLRIKETDRILALKNELSKVEVKIIDADDFFQISGKALPTKPSFESYQDHRMAMSLACLACLGRVEIKNPEVVTKSYPNYWKDLLALGFLIEPL